jgi:hypothetical protein
MGFAASDPAVTSAMHVGIQERGDALSIEQEEHGPSFSFFALGDVQAVLRAEFVLFRRVVAAVEGAGDDGRLGLTAPGRAGRIIEAGANLDLLNGDIASEHIRLLFVSVPSVKLCRNR